jgi:hypothetical protein
MEWKKVEEYWSFETTPEELEEQGIIFVPHKGFQNQATIEKREKVWTSHLLSKRQRSN